MTLGNKKRDAIPIVDWPKKWEREAKAIPVRKLGEFKLPRTYIADHIPPYATHIWVTPQ